MVERLKFLYLFKDFKFKHCFKNNWTSNEKWKISKIIFFSILFFINLIIACLVYLIKKTKLLNKENISFMSNYKCSFILHDKFYEFSNIR